MGSDSLFWGLRAGRFVVFQHRFVEWNQKKRIEVRLVYLFSPKQKKIWDLLLDAFLEPLFFSRKCWDIWLPQNECNKQTWLKHQPYKGGPPNKPVLSVGPKSHSELILGWGRETWVKPPWTFWGFWHGATHGNSPCRTNGDRFLVYFLWSNWWFPTCISSTEEAGLAHLPPSVGSKAGL